jgi:serine/threonine-protein kinase RsbW
MSHGGPDAAGDVPPGEVSIHVQVAAVAAEVSRLRHAVLESATAHGLAPVLRGDIALAVGEACANVVAHAYPEAVRPGPLTVDAYLQGREFVVVVSDEGTGIGPRTDSSGLGLGLALIARLTQRVEIGSNALGGAKLRMVFAA